MARSALAAFAAEEQPHGKKQNAYVSAIEAAIAALDDTFMRANAAETLVPLVPVSGRWQLSEDERASYQVTPEHWGARLCLMSAHESLHAALRIAASSGAHEQPEAAAWRDAAQRAAESARLALEAESALKDSAAAAEQASASAAADARAAEDAADAADAAQAKPADNLGDLDDMNDD